MKTVIKHINGLVKQEISFTVDESLNKLKGKILAPKKLEDANMLLRKLKSPLPQ